jgi:hypothetical protein
MKAVFLFLSLILSGCVLVDKQPDTAIFYGSRASDPAVGIQTDYSGTNGVGPEVSMIVSEDKTGSHEVEAAAGIRYTFDLSNNWQSFLSGGLAIQNPSTGDVAPYGQIGLDYWLDKHYTFGAMYRRSFWENDPVDSIVFGFGYSF